MTWKDWIRIFLVMSDLIPRGKLAAGVFAVPRTAAPSYSSTLMPRHRGFAKLRFKFFQREKGGSV